ncbi:MAG: NADH-quinone oxidoreductase subunit J family protein [Candidatus Dormibacterales bacterium]
MLGVAVFWITAVVAVVGGLGVILLREPIKSVLSLVVVMLAISVMFLLLSAQFLFAVQIIVYAGAVMVLFLFVIALLGPAREKGPGRLRFQAALSAVFVAALLGFILAMLHGITYRAPAPGHPSASLFGTVQQIAVGLFTTYLYPFELTSLLLLTAAVGAIYLSRRERGR